MNRTTLTFKIPIQASQQTVFRYVADWERQSDWIMFTNVQLLSERDQNQGAQLLATTQIGPFKVVDTMEVTTWQPPERIVVEHTGRQILGKGVFTVREISADSSEFTWEEITPVPFGAIGRIGLVIFEPLIRIPFTISLRRLQAQVEALKSTQV